MRNVCSLLSLVFVAALVIAVPLSAHSQTLTPFDPTGSTSTFPFSINPAGAITGFTLTPASRITASFEMLTAPSPRSTLPARPRAPSPSKSIRRGQSRDTTPTPAR